MTFSLSGRLATRLTVITGVGVTCAVIAGVGGAAWIRATLGASPAESFAKVEAEVRQRLDASTAALASISQQVAAARELIRRVPDDPTRAPSLFEVLARAVPAEVASTTGVTVYDARRVPIAWAGRVFEFPGGQSQNPSGLFVQADPFGPRLVRIEALADRGAVAARPPVIVAEQRLGDVRTLRGQRTAFLMRTSLAPVTVTVGARVVDVRAPAGAHTFAVRDDRDQLLLQGTVERADIDRAHAEASARVRAGVSLVIALTLLGYAAAALDVRRRVRGAAALAATSALLALCLGAARVVLRQGGELLSQGGWLTPPADLAFTALLLLSWAWLTLDLLDRWRLARRARPPMADRSEAALWTAVGYFLAGGVTAGVLVSYSSVLRSAARLPAFDVLQFSLHPFGETRIATAAGLVLLHAGIVWGAAAVTRVVSVVRRRQRSDYLRLVGVVTWGLGAIGAQSVASRWAPNLPMGWLLLATAAVGLAAAALERPRGPVRRASQAARLGLLYLALLMPALTTYPLLHAFASEAKEQRIAEEYGPLAARQREDLKERLGRTLEQIDARTMTPVKASEPGAAPDAQPAFEMWRSTDLDAYRLTSAIELYGAEGRLASRFALRLPEAAPISYRDASCEWDVLDEVSPIGSSERRVLRASRAICAPGGRRLGTIVVRVMLDSRTLPFIRGESPYLSVLGPERAGDGAPPRDIEFVAYGWSRVPLNTSGAGVWSLSDTTFDRLVRTRVPFWQTVERQGVRYRVYFLSDRGGIYALGYPVISALGHVVNLAELIVLVGLTYLLLLIGATLVSAVAAGGLSGRALLREVRSSFYRKLVAAFVVIAAVPVFVLAIATRTYFAAQARAGVEAEAIKTVTVAQRLVEDYALIQRGEASALDTIDDQTMVLVGRAIDQTVNLFVRDRLRATSERDLFASSLLTPRTSAAVYRSIVLGRLPAFVGEEDVNGSPYLVAAAPVRAGEREGIVTVPQTLRQREIEAQIDELNRQVISAAVLFVLIAAAIGYWMAERIADPVNRLTRATRRIARGDLDARIAATSSDELRRLVEDFNRMAADLQRQRSELERTQRLEAWADMARQVAHDIKNPLTPIQLSAEHVQRVNLDRGRPLSPVLDECVGAILSQVRLLRQISSEFSSFASSPTPRPEPTELAHLIDEVVDPYRTALADRIPITLEADTDLPGLVIDRTLFARALTNVIENALHAMPGAGRLSIGVTRSADGRSVAVAVRDNGVGMDAEALGRVFEPYFSTKARGTGLGLTIAKRNVELNGGTIAVVSEKGVGTTVTLTLPCPE